MGNCTTKPSSQKQLSLRNIPISRRTASSLHGQVQQETSQDGDENENKVIQFNEQPIRQVKACQNEQIKRHKSCILEEGFGDQSIAKIVRLESACISLKSKLEKLKREMVTLSKKEKQAKAISKEDNYFYEVSGSTHVSINRGQNQKQQGLSIENDIACYDTMIKLADYIQEKSYRLWENSNDIEIYDALSSLFWAAKKLSLPCLFDFQNEITQFLDFQQLSII